MSSLRPFGPSYLANLKGADSFLPLDFRNHNDRHVALSQAQDKTCSPALVQSLREQNQMWGSSPAREAHLDALSQPGTTVVVTGQQAGLFLGPLYSFYKAASAIAMAKELSRETRKPVVPIFWLQTEDHDFPEICATHVPQTAEPPMRLEADDTAPDTPRISIQHRVLGASVDVALEELNDVLEGLPHASEVMTWLRQAYRSEHRWGDAFATAMASCFAEEGLVLLDPRDPAIAELTRPVHRWAIQSSHEVGQLLSARAHSLEEAGFAVQVSVRSDCCLSFFHPDGPTSERFRLTHASQGWSLAGRDQAYTTDELLRVLEESPLQFSTSALLRPLMQDFLLPTVAYVGGPGELSYFGQLAPLYEAFERNMPLIASRGRFVIVDSKSKACLEIWGLSFHDLQQPEDQLLALLQKDTQQDINAESVRSHLVESFQASLDEISEKLLLLEPGLQKSIEKTARSVEGLVGKLAQKVERIQLHQDEQLVHQVRTVKERLFPADAPQERILGLPYFAARFGLAVIKETLWKTYKPFSTEVQELLL